MKLRELERESAALGFRLHRITKHRHYADAAGRRIVVTAHPGHELRPARCRASGVTWPGSTRRRWRLRR
jgi:predicted RNA binding protein YcfA (HicA-like mRNA interferase family)